MPGWALRFKLGSVEIDGRQRPSLLLFFVGTYAVTWTCFILIAVGAPSVAPYQRFFLLLGAYSPSLIAVSLTARVEGSEGVRSLIGHALQWRVPVRYYLFAATYVVVLKLSAALILRATTGVWPRFGTDPWYMIVAAVLFSTPFQAGEELGWRGYALPRLAGRLGVAGASLVVGLIWAVWHLPQFFVRAADTYGQSFFLFVLQVVGFSVALSWLWARTGGSILLPMLLHSAYNNSKDIVPSAITGAANPFTLHASNVAWLTTAGLWLVATFLLVEMSQDRTPKRVPA